MCPTHALPYTGPHFLLPIVLDAFILTELRVVALPKPDMQLTLVLVDGANDCRIFDVCDLNDVHIYVPDDMS